jgi:glucose/mannose transport system substrate-binding protein
LIDIFRRPRRLAALLAALSALAAAGQAAAVDIEVFHYLDRRADQERVAMLKSALKARGHGWKDFTVAFGWSGLGESMLRSRVQSGNPPSVAMMKTPGTHYWASRGALLSLDGVAAAGHWDQLLPKAVADTVKYKGRYFAIPLNLHRLNWLWINERILKEAGARPPTTWDEFFAVAEAISRAGYVPVSHSGRDSQNVELFEIVVLGVGGPLFYRKALIEYDAAELTSPAMERALRIFRRIKGYTEWPGSGQIRMPKNTKFETGEVGMHLMGDWANPAMYPPEKAAPFKTICVPAPGSGAAFAFTVDSFALFRTSAEEQKAQTEFAAAVMSPEVQRLYSVRKGSIPASTAADTEGYHPCALKSQAAFQAAAQANALVPVISMTASREVEDGLREAISDFWNDERVAPSITMQRLVAATRRH